MRMTMVAFSVPARKERKHYTLSADCLAFIDKLGVQWGLERSDVIRRLVDDAQMKDREL